MTNEKWYNSDFFNYLGGGLAMAAICLGIGYGVRSCQGPTSEQVELEKIRARQEVQIADINGNGVKDKFYIVNDRIALIELDGIPVSGSLDAKLIQK